MRRIKSTFSNFWKGKPFFGSHQTILVEKSAFKHKMFSKKSALSSDETVEVRYRDIGNFDQQGARAFKNERTFQTYGMLKKKQFYFGLQLNQNYKSLSGKSWADLHDVGFS